MEKRRKGNKTIRMLRKVSFSFQVSKGALLSLFFLKKKKAISLVSMLLID